MLKKCEMNFSHFWICREVVTHLLPCSQYLDLHSVISTWSSTDYLFHTSNHHGRNDVETSVESGLTFLTHHTPCSRKAQRNHENHQCTSCRQRWCHPDKLRLHLGQYTSRFKTHPSSERWEPSPSYWRIFVISSKNASSTWYFSMSQERNSVTPGKVKWDGHCIFPPDCASLHTMWLSKGLQQVEPITQYQTTPSDWTTPLVEPVLKSETNQGTPKHPCRILNQLSTKDLGKFVPIDLNFLYCLKNKTKVDFCILLLQKT